MGSKKINSQNGFEMFLAGNNAMSGTSTIIGKAQHIENFDNLSIQLIWTGTPTGTITVSRSNNGTIFDDLILSPAITQPAGGAGHWSVDINQISSPWVRVSYTNASGSGVLSATLFSKDLN